jgi:hypothetical protein
MKKLEYTSLTEPTSINTRSNSSCRKAGALMFEPRAVAADEQQACPPILGALSQ